MSDTIGFDPKTPVQEFYEKYFSEDMTYDEFLEEMSEFLADYFDIEVYGVNND